MSEKSNKYISEEIAKNRIVNWLLVNKQVNGKTPLAKKINIIDDEWLKEQEKGRKDVFQNSLHTIRVKMSSYVRELEEEEWVEDPKGTRDIKIAENWKEKVTQNILDWKDPVDELFEGHFPLEMTQEEIRKFIDNEFGGSGLSEELTGVHRDWPPSFTILYHLNIPATGQFLDFLKEQKDKMNTHDKLGWIFFAYIWYLGATEGFGEAHGLRITKFMHGASE